VPSSPFYTWKEPGFKNDSRIMSHLLSDSGVPIYTTIHHIQNSSILKQFFGERLFFFAMCLFTAMSNNGSSQESEMFN